MLNYTKCDSDHFSRPTCQWCTNTLRPIYIKRHNQCTVNTATVLAILYFSHRKQGKRVAPEWGCKPFWSNSIQALISMTALLLVSSQLWLCICHQYFLITISSTWRTQVSSWSNRPLLSGGDSSCSWVFYSCTGPKGWILTLQEGCQLGSTCVSQATLYLEYPPEYSRKRTQTSSFSCKVYWETGTGSLSGVTAI